MSATRVILFACLATGCSMSSFDDQRAQAWSDSNSAADLSSSNFGVAVAGVTTDNPGATIAVLGVAPLGLGVVTYDQTGELRLSGVDIPGFDGATATLPALAAAPEPTNGATGLVAIGGLGDADQILLYDVSTEVPTQVGTLSGADCGAPGTNLGSNLSFAFTTAGEDDKFDLVALRGNEMFLFTDVDPSSTTHECARCPLGDEGATVLDFATYDLEDAVGFDILVSIDGVLSGFDSALITEANNASVGCFDIRTPQISNLPSPNGESDFGSQIAVGDGNGDGFLEVAVSAPSTNTVYIIPGLDGSGPGGLFQTLVAPGDSGNFGAGPMAFIDIAVEEGVDPEDGDELVVGDPLASPSGVAEAGQVTVYDYSSDEGFERRAILFDSVPETEQHYGRALSPSEFSFGQDDADVLAVGAQDEVFTLFRSLTNGVDPRQ